MIVIGCYFLFRFEKEQSIFDIGGTMMGGQPDELPAVLIGSLFHEGYKIVENKKPGNLFFFLYIMFYLQTR